MDLIKEGDRDEWEYKKEKTNFLKGKKRGIKADIGTKRDNNDVNNNNRNRELGNFKR